LPDSSGTPNIQSTAAATRGLEGPSGEIPESEALISRETRCDALAPRVIGAN